MTPEKERQLVERFPDLYRDLYHHGVEEPERTSDWFRDEMIAKGMPGWGEAFTCGDGWHGIIERLSEHLARLVQTQPEGERWRFAVFQVKERIGELRLYMNATDEMRAAILAAQEESSRTCELCGAPGTSDLKTHRRGQWVAVRCELCPRGRRPPRPKPHPKR